MNRRLPLGSPPAGAGSRTTSPAAVSRPARRLIGVMLVAAAARWAVWAALLTGAASAPQAAVSGFSTPYTIPDTATAVLGILLAVAVLATVGQTGVPGDDTQSVITRHYPMIRDAAAPAPAQRARGS
jgi:hypothetical protein